MLGFRHISFHELSTNTLLQKLFHLATMFCSLILVSLKKSYYFQSLGVYCLWHYICHEALFPWILLYPGSKGGFGSGVCTSPDCCVSWVLWGKWGERLRPASIVTDTFTTMFWLWEFYYIISGNICGNTHTVSWLNFLIDSVL